MPCCSASMTNLVTTFACDNHTQSTCVEPTTPSTRGQRQRAYLSSVVPAARGAALLKAMRHIKDSHGRHVGEYCGAVSSTDAVPQVAVVEECVGDAGDGWVAPILCPQQGAFAAECCQATKESGFDGHGLVCLAWCLRCGSSGSHNAGLALQCRRELQRVSHSWSITSVSAWVQLHRGEHVVGLIPASLEHWKRPRGSKETGSTI